MRESADDFRARTGLAPAAKDYQDMLAANELRGPDDRVCELTLAKQGIEKRHPGDPDTCLVVHIKRADVFIPLQTYARLTPASSIAHMYEHIVAVAAGKEQK